LWGKPLLLSLLLLGRSKFETFLLNHNEQPMLKSIFQEIWEKEEYILDESCSRFRKEASINQYLIRYWQFASNRFYPIKKNGLAYYHYNKEIVDDLIKNLMAEQHPSICINDSQYFCEEDFIYTSSRIRNALEKKFPNISMFEKKP